jgi:hypothetical protein
MMRGTRALWLAALGIAALTVAADAGLAAKAPALVPLPAGARIGVVNLLDAQVTHFHSSRKLEDSFLKAYTVDWSVSSMLLAALKDGATQRALTVQAVAPSDELRRARETCFLDAALAKGLPKPCGPLYAQLAAGAHVDAIIVLGPGRNDSTHAGGTRHKELPEYLRGWCFVTGEGTADQLPTLLNLTELLLVQMSNGEARLAGRQWGGDGQSWIGYQPPADLKAFSDAQLEQLQPLFSAMLKQQADRLLATPPVSR